MKQKEENIKPAIDFSKKTAHSSQPAARSLKKAISTVHHNKQKSLVPTRLAATPNFENEKREHGKNLPLPQILRHRTKSTFPDERIGRFSGLTNN